MTDQTPIGQTCPRVVVGSLCTGYGGLDLAVNAVLGNTTTAWVSEFDEHAAKVTASHFDVPNLGDLTVVDWRDIDPVDVLTAGYPCQPFSAAGRRKGTDDDRHIWPHIARAIGVLRPRLVILENVAGHLSLGFDRVLGELAELGFDAEWCVVRASDVGACHQRKRLFVVATDPNGVVRSTGRPLQGCGGSLDEPSPLERVERLHGSPASDSRGPRAGRDSRAVPRSAPESRRSGADVHAPRNAGQGAPYADHGTDDRQRTRTQPRHGDQDATDTERDGRPRGDHSGGGEGLGAPGGEPARAHPTVAWGDYEPAIRRHEYALGRSAPSPVDDKGRLSPMFVEWMMMLPAGWVTALLRTDIDPRPCHLSRAQALKILGNGVVPAQAAYAIAHLLDRHSGWRVAA